MDAVGAVWLAIAVFTLPGLLFAWVAGAKLPAAAAASLPATFGIVGLASWMYGAMGIRFGWTSFVVFLILMLCVAGGWRYAFARRAKRRGAASWRRALWPGDWRKGSIADPSWVLPGAGVAVGAWMLIAKQLELQSQVPGQLKNVVQGWDTQWHVNAVRFIMDEGIASPTRMGELQNPQTHLDLFYPSAFHAATALFGHAAGLEPVEALNLASIVLPSLALTAGAAGLAWAMARGHGMVAQIAAGLAGIAVYASPVLVWIPDFVGMRPYIVAIGLSGIAIALFMQVPRYRALALPTLFAFLGMMQVHPSAVLVVVLAVALYWLTYLLWHPDRSRVGDLLWLAIPAIGAPAAFLPQLLAGSSQAEEVNTWDAQESVTAAEAWEKAFMMRTRHVGEFFPDFDPTVLLWLAGFGAVAVVVWRGQVWAPVFYGIMVACTAHALRPFEGMWEPLLTALGAPHYNSAHRIVTVVAMTVIAAAAVGVAVIIRVFALAPIAARYGTRPWVWGTSAASAVLAVFAGWGTGAWASTVAVDGAGLAFDASRVNDRMVDDDQLKAYQWLASRPETKEGLVMGESTDGYSWAYGLYGVPTVARHYLWPSGGMGTDSIVLGGRAGQLGAGEKGHPDAVTPVDEAAADLGVRFIVSSGNTFWNGPRNWQVHKALWSTPGVTPVYQRGQVTIFAVDKQFTDSELAELQKDAVANGGSTEIPELRPLTEELAAADE